MTAKIIMMVAQLFWTMVLLCMLGCTNESRNQTLIGENYSHIEKCIGRRLDLMSIPTASDYNMGVLDKITTHSRRVFSVPEYGLVGIVDVHGRIIAMHSVSALVEQFRDIHSTTTGDSLVGTHIQQLRESHGDMEVLWMGYMFPTQPSIEDLWQQPMACVPVPDSGNKHIEWMNLFGYVISNARAVQK